MGPPRHGARPIGGSPCADSPVPRQSGSTELPAEQTDGRTPQEGPAGGHGPPGHGPPREGCGGGGQGAAPCWPGLASLAGVAPGGWLRRRDKCRRKPCGARLCLVTGDAAQPRCSLALAGDSPEPVRPPPSPLSGSLPQTDRLVCYVTGFYPPEIEVKWFKNGREETERVVATDVIQNGDWTYQVLVMLETSPQPRDTYTCQVEHLLFRLPYRLLHGCGGRRGAAQRPGRQPPPSPRRPQAPRSLSL
uniref:Ig-like domain-containing protein n=1 Tax=Dromaius novaehollandiae TaxID=8790 RepID=A0A8C4PA10_DRONO